MINPGSTSVKLGYYRAPDESNVEELNYNDQTTFLVSHQEVEGYKKSLGKIVLDYLKKQEARWGRLTAVAARGGLLKPVAGGVMEICREMVDDLINCRYGWHPSNLAPVIAWELARERNIPAFIVDPISTDELAPLARLSGYPGIWRRSFSHALNMKQVAREVAEEELAVDYNRCRLIVVHMGGRISVSAHQDGRMIDLNDGRSEGPFGIEGSGSLPVYELLKYMEKHELTAAKMWEKLQAGSGLAGYLGTRDFRRIEVGYGKDRRTTLVVDALAYQIAKEIAAEAAVLGGKVDGIILAGGLANSRLLTGKIGAKVDWIGRVFIRPGEREMEALGLGVCEAVSGKRPIRQYRESTVPARALA